MDNNKIKQIIELRQQGKTYKEIQEITGCCKNTCIKYLKQYKIEPKRKVIPITEELMQEIQKRYDEIKNIKVIAKEFHISASRLRKYGLKVINPVKSQEEFNAQTTYARKVKERLIEYKGGKCCICGYNKCGRALEFHHLNPSEKDFCISGGTKSFENMKVEVDKCVLVCANCHREIHEGITKI